MKNDILIISRLFKNKLSRHWIVRTDTNGTEGFLENVTFKGAVIAMASSFEEASVIVMNLSY